MFNDLGDRSVLRTALLAVCALLCSFAFLLAFPQQAHAKTFILGDSRGCWLYNTLYSGYEEEIFAVEQDGNEVWKTRICMGAVWFDSICAPYVDKNVRAGDDIIICLGVNDMWNVDDYARSVNRNAARWQRAGANTYFVSVNAVDDEESEARLFYQRDRDTRQFNERIQMLLDPGVVTYIDTRSYFDSGKEPYHTNDGLHYDDKTGRIVYGMVYKALSESHPDPMAPHPTLMNALLVNWPVFVLCFLASFAAAWAVAGTRREHQGSSAS